MSAPLFFVETTSLTGSQLELTGGEGRHAADVLRLRVGERVDVSDGAGRVARGTVSHAERGRLVVDVADVVSVARPAPRLVVAQAIAKGGRDEQAVEAMTEIGVDGIIAWQADRSIAKASARTVDKWHTAVRTAGKQSRRVWLPDIAGPVNTVQLIDRITGAIVIVLHEEATEPLAGVTLPLAGEVIVVVGPEGGIDPAELDAFVAAGAVVRRLGDTVLRTSTAGAAALSVLFAATRWR